LSRYFLVVWSQALRDWVEIRCSHNHLEFYCEYLKRTKKNLLRKNLIWQQKISCNFTGRKKRSWSNLFLWGCIIFFVNNNRFEILVKLICCLICSVWIKDVNNNNNNNNTNIVLLEWQKGKIKNIKNLRRCWCFGFWLVWTNALKSPLLGASENDGGASIVSWSGASITLRYEGGWTSLSS